MTIIFCFTLMAMVQSDQNEHLQDCISKSGEGAIYLRDFIVSLPQAETDERPPTYRQAIILRSNNIYRFNLCNNYGQAILRLYDSSNMLLTSLNTKTNEEYNPINFLCRKTGLYNIIITFKDGEAGEAVGIMSHVKE